VEDVLAVAWVAGHPGAESDGGSGRSRSHASSKVASGLGDFLAQLVVHGVLADRTNEAGRKRYDVIPERGSIVLEGPKGPVMLIYYDWNASPNCLKTKILLNELGIEYEQRSVDRPTLQSAEFRGEVFRAGQAPAIEDGDVRISESGAISRCT